MKTGGTAEVLMVKKLWFCSLGRRQLTTSPPLFNVEGRNYKQNTIEQIKREEECINIIFNLKSRELIREVKKCHRDISI